MSRTNRVGLGVFLTLITLSLQKPVNDDWNAISVAVIIFLVLVGCALLSWPNEGE